MRHTLPLRALVNSPIIEVIIDKMMIHPEDMDGISQELILASFEATLDSLEGDDAGPISHYAITVNNTRQFTLVAQYLASGLLFWQVSCVLANTKEVLGIRSIGSCMEGLSASMLVSSVQ